MLVTISGSSVMATRCSLIALMLGALFQIMPGAGEAHLTAVQRTSGVTKSSFGTAPGGAAVDMYTLTNASGVEVRAITYGGIITGLRVPDRAGSSGDVVLGFDRLDG